MPIYEYRCAACGHQEEHLQKISEKPLAACPACGKRAYKKMLSAAGRQRQWLVRDRLQDHQQEAGGRRRI
jgi:putative FmdB family regulatory protein